MSVPVFFAVKRKESINFPNARYIQPGFGFTPQGAVRLPASILPDVPILLDDAFLPPTPPAKELLVQLAHHGGKGIILDFERPPCPLHTALANELRTLLPAVVPIWAPEPYLQETKGIRAKRICQNPCNDWQSFCRTGAHYEGWLLELTPWRLSRADNGSDFPARFLPNPLCFAEHSNGRLRYFDTRKTLLQKLDAAKKYGCIGAVGILKELPED